MDLEKYIINNNEDCPEILYGSFKNLIYEKNKLNYGKLSADETLISATHKLQEIILQQDNSNLTNNTLLVGKVQSGKTSALEMFTALAFDNGYQMVVIYGGYDSTLLRQTKDRFAESFDANTEKVVLLTTDDKGVFDKIDSNILNIYVKKKKPIIVITMKRSTAMKKTNALLKKISDLNLKTFIIDDEGDQAGPNIAKDKQKEMSATYKQIVKMKSILKDPPYLSVTATPHVNIFLDEYSAIKPDNILLIEPAEDYCGCNEFHLNNNLVQIVNDDIAAISNEKRLPISLRESLNYFFIASALKVHIDEKNGSKSDMIIHSYKETAAHFDIEEIVNSYIDDLKSSINNNSPDLDLKCSELEQCYNKYFKDSYNKNYSFNSIKEDVFVVIATTKLFLKNSSSISNPDFEKLIPHKIYIGGELLQRGVTFKNLITTYFTRWAKTGGNMDTNLQRARWFGYRSKYLKLCKIFTTIDIANEFSGLAESENELWEEFYQFGQGNLSIDDIVIPIPDLSKQKPFRKNAALYKRIKANRWLSQKYSIVDKISIKKNNDIIEELKNSYSLLQTTKGRRDNTYSADYINVPPSELIDYILKLDGIFSNRQFGTINKRIQSLILEQLEDIPIIFISKKNGDPRERALTNDYAIPVLQQGASSDQPNKIIYEGDASVIVNPENINIQIHKILPIYNNVHQDIQYAFALYIPNLKSYYARGEND